MYKSSERGVLYLCGKNGYNTQPVPRTGRKLVSRVCMYGETDALYLEQNVSIFLETFLNNAIFVKVQSFK